MVSETTSGESVRLTDEQLDDLRAMLSRVPSAREDPEQQRQSAGICAVAPR
jgi:hypothetical protein